MNSSYVSFSLSISSIPLQFVFLNIQPLSPSSQNWEWPMILWDPESYLEAKNHIYSS